jgi:uncharacterized protein
MTQKTDVDDFLNQKKLAVVGVSRKKSKFGNVIYRELKKRGYKVYPINPATESIEGDTCYNDLKSLPEKVDGAVLVVPPAVTDTVVKDAIDAGISRLWMQQGSQSPSAVDLCNQNDINVVQNECILMFADPVNSIHKFHRWLWKVFGKLPN